MSLLPEDPELSTTHLEEDEVNHQAAQRPAAVTSLRMERCAFKKQTKVSNTHIQTELGEHTLKLVDSFTEVFV